MSRTALAGRVAGALLLLAASVGASAATLHRIGDARADQRAADATASQQLGRQAQLEEQVAQLEVEIGIAADAATRDASDARSLTDSTALLARMRTRIERVRSDIATKTAERRKRQQPIDLLVSCQRVLDEAASELGTPTYGDQLGTAVGTLEAGRVRCQAALALLRGANGAVHPYDFPDPFVLPIGPLGYLAFATNGPAGSIQVLASNDLQTWRVQSPATTGVPGWAERGYSWAPSVQRVGDVWILYYAVRERSSQRQCITTAVSTLPGGPYIDGSTGPLICQRDLGGSIDPSSYRDELGFQHLVWKSEGELTGGRSGIWTQVIGGDGRSLIGTPTELLVADQEWEHKIIENPTMTKVGDQWVLLYSGNRWNTTDYAIGYALCAGSGGPCTRPPQPVALRSSASLQGPGGAAVFRTPSGTTMVAFAAWDPGQVGFPNPRRLHLAKVALTPLGLVVG